MMLFSKGKREVWFYGVDGQFLIDPIFDDANHFVSYESKVTKGGKSYIIDEQGDCIDPCD
jgi:hypothetical protein